jgi:lipopolysaccharide heptosyltransferase I
MKSVLIVRLSALGDTVCTLPVATAIREQFPQCRIAWAVDPRFKGIVECCPDVDEVIVCKPGFTIKSWPKFDRTFDAVLDMQGLTKSGIVAMRAKADRKLGFHWQRELAPLFSAKVLPDPSSIHVVDQYVDVARYLGAQMETATFNLLPKPEDIEKCKSLVSGANRLLVFNAGAGWATKRWLPSSFAQVIDHFTNIGYACALIGAPGRSDIEAAQAVTATCARPPLNLLGKTSVRELVALISMCKAHIGGDTGSTHIAAALGKPLVGLYSITRPERSGPYGMIDNCLYDSALLANINPIDVINKLETLLNDAS